MPGGGARRRTRLMGQSFSYASASHCIRRQVGSARTRIGIRSGGFGPSMTSTSHATRVGGPLARVIAPGGPRARPSLPWDRNLHYQRFCDIVCCAPALRFWRKSRISFPLNAESGWISPFFIACWRIRLTSMPAPSSEIFINTFDPE